MKIHPTVISSVPLKDVGDDLIIPRNCLFWSKTVFDPIPGSSHRA